MNETPNCPFSNYDEKAETPNGAFPNYVEEKTETRPQNVNGIGLVADCFMKVNAHTPLMY